MLKLGFVYFINDFLKISIKRNKKISRSINHYIKNGETRTTYIGAHICHRIKETKKIIKRSN